MKNPRTLKRSFLGYSKQEGRGRKGEKTEAEEAGEREEESIGGEEEEKAKESYFAFQITS